MPRGEASGAEPGARAGRSFLRTGFVRPGDPAGVLPTWLLPPALAAAIWAAVAPFWLSDLSTLDAELTGTLPGGVVLLFAVGDYALWRRRGRPWHDWGVILLGLPAIAAAVWLTVAGLALELDLTRNELLALEVGPGIALVGLLTTTISFHGRHHPDER